ncbi:ankyrin repeat-containing protein [Lasiosphaeria miniovina]|uniref:Ankyrin repeat-containing protein n=1 Tax=Lasiosphaeria miniovina TaxID=1954250 RepID=A0AA40AAX7_9PEZI|nr:ankyrin repeat-containing protein [Lasiosphaeria miniovina]KAK0712502.1 ankyrin repeat-containing protein [Lasiosphaeria miniovina]
MRLLRTEVSAGRLQLCEFSDDAIPEYAILSHTWGEDEVTLQDIRAEARQLGHLSGYEKILNCCARAKADGHDYVWIDTCCIDKTSSAELSETINSMYRWYERAGQCYAFLADVPSKSSFSESRWFTRGWTLQELIAPPTVVFVDGNWNDLGTKVTLQQDISRRTNISPGVLAGNVSDASVAQKMSWAAGRQTTRAEDTAYCLMGLFGVNMPLLYGEGERGFLRLQEEIIKISDDHSILAWQSRDNRGGLLATGPAAFAESGDIVVRHPPVSDDRSLTINSRGAHLNIPFMGLLQSGVGLGLLNCTKVGSGNGVVGVFLLDRHLDMNRLERTRTWEFAVIDVSKIGPSQRPVRRICAKLGRLEHTWSRRSVKPAKAAASLEEGDFDDSQIPDLFLVLSGYSGMRNDDKTRASLLQLASLGDGDGVCRYLASGILSADLRDDKGRTALMRAAESGHMGVVWLLLARSDVSPSAKDNAGMTALSLAARKDRRDVVKALMARSDMQQHLVDGFGRTLLSHAAQAGQELLVEYLLLTGTFEPDAQDLDGRRVIQYAFRGGHAGVMKLLIETDRPGPHRHIEASNRFGITPLLIAVQNGSIPIATALLEKGANIEAENKAGQRSLALAAIYGNGAMMRLLLDKGADIDAKDNEGFTPLNTAVMCRRPEIVELLLDRGANMEAANAQGRAPLAVASNRGLEPTVRLLLAKGAEIDAGHKTDYTALAGAIDGLHPEVVQLLLDNGADAGKLLASTGTILRNPAGQGFDMDDDKVRARYEKVEALLEGIGYGLKYWSSKSKKGKRKKSSRAAENAPFPF